MFYIYIKRSRLECAGRVKKWKNGKNKKIVRTSNDIIAGNGRNLGLSKKE
jgi:hypothetical protein